MSKTSLKTTVEWHKMNWRKLERRVYKLQQRIYRASSRGDVKAVRKLQKMLMNSWSAQCLAVRKNNFPIKRVEKHSFDIRQYKVGKSKAGFRNGKKSRFEIVINPSQEPIKSYLRKIDQTLERHQSSSQKILIQQLNRIIEEWKRLYSGLCSRELSSRLNHLLHLKLKAWAKKRHPNKSQDWIIQKYWHRMGNSRWRFAVKVGADLMMLIQQG